MIKSVFHWVYTLINPSEAHIYVHFLETEKILSHLSLIKQKVKLFSYYQKADR